jgi:hypothetical protein
LVFIARIVVMLGIAVALAYWSTDTVLRQTGRFLVNGPWNTSLATGSQTAGPYHRARIARHGLWALDSSEVLYFHADTTSQGEPLRAGGSYLVVGTDPDTRWWSVTAYVDDHLIPNPDDRYSFSSTTVAREPDGSWQILVSPDPRPGNWLPNGHRPGQLVLTLRCYNPGPGLAADPANAQLPRIVREDLP